MASAPVELAAPAATGGLLYACVTEHGCASHSYLASDDLLKGPHASRNLADFIHFLCVLHGRHPGVIDHAANRTVDPLARTWFNAAIDSFAAERAFLTRLAVAVGPMPSTPGASGNDAVVRAQRHAVEMLSQSERNGCAVGAALALTIDWDSIRNILNVAGTRFGVEGPVYSLNDVSAICGLADGLEGGPGPKRALLFGAEQIALQHRGLCDLLEARQQARSNY